MQKIEMLITSEPHPELTVERQLEIARKYFSFLFENVYIDDYEVLTDDEKHILTEEEFKSIKNLLHEEWRESLKNLGD